MNKDWAKVLHCNNILTPSPCLVSMNYCIACGDSPNFNIDEIFSIYLLCRILEILEDIRYGQILNTCAHFYYHIQIQFVAKLTY